MSEYIIKIYDLYSNYLCDLISPYIFDGFKSIYHEGKTISNKENILTIFQELLNTIPNWSENIIKTETERIVLESGCNNLENILKSTIKSYLCIISLNNELLISLNDGLLDDIKLNKFIHNIYCDSAKKLYQNPYLIYDEYEPNKVKNNYIKMEDIIKHSIKNSVINIINIEEILNFYINYDLQKINIQPLSQLIPQPPAPQVENNEKDDLNISDNIKKLLDQQLQAIDGNNTLLLDKQLGQTGGQNQQSNPLQLLQQIQQQLINQNSNNQQSNNQQYNNQQDQKQINIDKTNITDKTNIADKHIEKQHSVSSGGSINADALPNNSPNSINTKENLNKIMEEEIKKISSDKQKGGKYEFSNLVERLDKDRGDKVDKYKLKQKHSDTSTDYNEGGAIIAEYSNSRSSSHKGNTKKTESIFIPQDSTDKKKGKSNPKYHIIK